MEDNKVNYKELLNELNKTMEKYKEVEDGFVQEGKDLILEKQNISANALKMLIDNNYTNTIIPVNDYVNFNIEFNNKGVLNSLRTVLFTFNREVVEENEDEDIDDIISNYCTTILKNLLSIYKKDEDKIIELLLIDPDGDKRNFVNLVDSYVQELFVLGKVYRKFPEEDEIEDFNLEDDIEDDIDFNNLDNLVDFTKWPYRTKPSKFYKTYKNDYVAGKRKMPAEMAMRALLKGRLKENNKEKD